MLSPQKGTLLISEPFLADSNFYRTVVLLTEHNETGSVGLVLNQQGDAGIQDLFEDIHANAPVFVGGPVSLSSMLFLHEHAELEGAEPVLPGLYWGGDFEMLKFLLREDLLQGRVKYFVGYSGWGPGQLQAELEQKSWIVAPARLEDVFAEPNELWKTELTRLGSAYRHLGNAPEDLQMN
jgi:putative transcriptional regulator